MVNEIHIMVIHKLDTKFQFQGASLIVSIGARVNRMSSQRINDWPVSVQERLRSTRVKMQVTSSLILTWHTNILNEPFVRFATKFHKIVDFLAP